MDFCLTILGCNSAKPCYGRHTTSQYLEIGNHAFLIDAGESVQKRISDFGLKPNKIQNIFISHLHGDHILGLPGFLTSLSLSSRTKPITVYGPPNLSKFIDTFLEISGSHISYPLSYVMLTEGKSEVILEHKDYTVNAFPVEHRIPTWGFRFDEKRSSLNISKEAIEKHGLSIEEIKAVKTGKDIVRDSNEAAGNNAETYTLKNEELILPSHKLRSYAYCADTVYTESFMSYINGADLIYHEATYLEDLKQQAKDRMHSTAKEAAQIAQKAGVKQLIIGHYSSRYKNVTPLLQEAKAVFPNTRLAEEGEKYIIEKKI